jgi:hypothetical protein
MTAKKKSANSRENCAAEGSKSNTVEDDLSDDPFADVISKNVMPKPPTQEKKVYLEDYEHFTVREVPRPYVLRNINLLIRKYRSLPEEDGSLFADVQDKLLRRQYRGLPALR